MVSPSFHHHLTYFPTRNKAFSYLHRGEGAISQGSYSGIIPGCASMVFHKGKVLPACFNTSVWPLLRLKCLKIAGKSMKNDEK